MPTEDRFTAARPPRQPAPPVPSFVVVLTLKNGRRKVSVPLSRLEDAETVAACSLLDCQVAAARIERREGVPA